MNVVSHSKNWSRPEYMDVVKKAIKVYSKWLDLDPNSFTVHLYDEITYEGEEVRGLADYDTFEIMLSAAVEKNGERDECCPLAILAHEMVHVGQFQHKYLQNLEEIGSVWLGEPWGDVNVFDMTYQEYQKLPWEAAAFEMQPKMREQLYKEYGI